MPSTTIRINVRKEGGFNLREKERRVKAQTTIGMRQLIEDIHRTSRPITPMLTGDLRGDVTKTTTRRGDLVRGTIEWNRPYAWYQERGYTRGPVRRYTTPGTKAHFAEESVKRVTSSSKRYFGKRI